MKEEVKKMREEEIIYILKKEEIIKESENERMFQRTIFKKLKKLCKRSK